MPKFLTIATIHLFKAPFLFIALLYGRRHCSEKLDFNLTENIGFFLWDTLPFLVKFAMPLWWMLGFSNDLVHIENFNCFRDISNALNRDRPHGCDRGIGGNLILIHFFHFLRCFYLRRYVSKPLLWRLSLPFFRQPCFLEVLSKTWFLLVCPMFTFRQSA